MAGFNVAINDKARYQDPNHALWGMGLSYGYAFSWGKDNRWGIEFNIGVGFAEYDYDAYRNRRMALYLNPVPMSIGELRVQE